MAQQKTYTMIKPAGVRKGHIGEILHRFERAGLKIERMELGMVTDEQAKANYAEHEGKPFYDGLISYITSGPVVKMVVSGDGAVAKCRSLMGATNPAEAAPGTIRGDFGLIMDENVIHGSDSPESAEREIGIFFAYSTFRARRSVRAFRSSDGALFVFRSFAHRRLRGIPDEKRT